MSDRAIQTGGSQRAIGVVGLVGIVVGAFLAWVTFRNVGLASVAGEIERVDAHYLLGGALVYFVALAVRSQRWRTLLLRTGSISRGKVLEGLVVGFATNFALPGRLGEIYRADFLKSVASISRTTALGTILIERAADGLFLVAMLLASLLVLRTGAIDGTGVPIQFIASAVAVFIGLAIALAALRRLGPKKGIAASLLDKLAVGLRALDTRNLFQFLLWSAIVVVLELTSIALLLRSLGLAPSVAATALVLSVASLSTLLPTAPAYVGSYQLAFVISFGVLDWSRSTGLAASVLLQMAYFVPVMVAGLALAARHYWTSAVGAAAMAKATPAAGEHHSALPAESEILYEGRDLEALSDMPNYYAWIMKSFAPHIRGDVLEYGSGAGTVSELLRRHAESLTLVEPSPNLVKLLQSRFAGAPNVVVTGATLEDHVASLADASIDAIVMVNVLEHVEQDQAALAELFRVLRPGGHLLLFVPALPALMSDFDRLIGHFRRYTKSDLRTKLQLAGANVGKCRYFDVAGIAPWFVFNTVLRRTTLNPTMLSIYDRFVVPVSRWVESWLSPPFGKNLLVVATKDSTGVA